MKFLLIGEYKTNAGPSNVNRKLIENSNFIYIKSSNRFIKFLETIIKIIVSDVCIMSGFSPENLIYSKITKILNKKSIYIMHGCIKYENEINTLGFKDKYVKKEIQLLKKVDLILCVSKKYSKWVKEYYPEVSQKIGYLNNGIDDYNNIEQNEYDKSKSYVISLIGGNRNIKNNKIVCDAINDLIDEGYNIKAFLFGRIYEGNESIEYKNIVYKGMIKQSELYKHLKKSNLYICASIVESFGLAIFDALVSGCDILVSNTVGALSILEVTEKDIINDINDKNEIKKKIIYMMSNHNNHRLVKGIEKGSDYKSRSMELYNICKKLVDEESV